MKLYEVAEQFNKLQEFSGDLSCDDDRVAFAGLFLEISEQFDQKAHNTCCVIKNLQAEAAVIKAEADRMKAEADRLTARSKACETKADNLMSYLEYQMKSVNCDEIKTTLFSIRIQKNPPKLGVDETALPEAYWKVERKPDVSKIKDALKSGEKIDGAWLEQSEGLRIR